MGLFTDMGALQHHECCLYTTEGNSVAELDVTFFQKKYFYRESTRYDILAAGSQFSWPCDGQN